MYGTDIRNFYEFIQCVCMCVCVCGVCMCVCGMLGLSWERGYECGHRLWNPVLYRVGPSCSNLATLHRLAHFISSSFLGAVASLRWDTTGFGDSLGLTGLAYFKNE